ncbi:MAG: DUF3006 domain-containing protein [Clostridia bacterium]|nr:DUF3006 domain-containing protein [Clostridia bacterium]MBQ4543843.1 DUF3006 domain-containing protein [Clostridia bacterium]MBQ7075575.1 DUF3006 domain-containing protein [Clostridia bacterium]MBQ9997721.1 DUF3006 domain-containing protein [Clostridia bacterium]
MKFSIDRIEGDFAVLILENGEIVNVPKKLFDNPKEGVSYSLTEVKSRYDTAKLLKEVFND